MIKSVLLAAVILSAGVGAAHAQSALVLPCYQNPSSGAQGCIPVSSANPLPVTGGGGGGGGAATIADGADVTQGAIADTATTAGGTGTVSAKLRETTSLLNSVLSAVTAPLPAAATTASCTALCSNLVLEANGPHQLYSFEVSADTTLSTAPWWVMAFNATSLPSNGAITPLKCYAVPANTTSFTAAFPTPVIFATGMTIGVSTTGCFTQTASVHAFISGDAQ